MPLVLSSVYVGTLSKLAFPYHLEKNVVVDPDRKATLGVIRNLFPEEQKNVSSSRSNDSGRLGRAPWLSPPASSDYETFRDGLQLSHAAGVLRHRARLGLIASLVFYGNELV